MMLPAESVFTPLERSVLNAICQVHPADRPALEAQLSTATLSSRENTGCGFFTSFAVDRSASAPVPSPRLRNGPLAKLEGMQYGLGFILWLEEGYADCLEGYAYGDDSTTELNFESVGFNITNPPNANPL
jgi:hypothetical protein